MIIDAAANLNVIAVLTATLTVMYFSVCVSDLFCLSVCLPVLSVCVWLSLA